MKKLITLILLLCCSSALAATHTATLTLKSNNPGGDVTVALTGDSAAATSVLEVSPAVQDYGVIDEGTSLTQTFTVTNTGVLDLTMDATPAVFAGSSMYTVGDVDCAGAVLATGGTCTVDLVYAPIPEITPSFYLSMDTLATTTPDIGSTMVSNTGATQTVGQVGNAYEYSTGTDGHAKINLADVNLTQGTIDFWVRPDYSGTPATNQSYFYGGSYFQVNHFATTGNLTFDYGFKQSIHTAWNPASGTWYHIVARYDNGTGTFSLEVAGAEQFSTVGVQTQPTPTVISVSREYRSEQDYAIDDLKIYDSVLP